MHSPGLNSLGAPLYTLRQASISNSPKALENDEFVRIFLELFSIFHSRFSFLKNIFQKISKVSKNQWSHAVRLRQLQLAAGKSEFCKMIRFFCVKNKKVLLEKTREYFFCWKTHFSGSRSNCPVEFWTVDCISWPRDDSSKSNLRKRLRSPASTSTTMSIRCEIESFSYRQIEQKKINQTIGVYGTLKMETFS